MKKQNLGQYNTKNSVWLRPHIIEFIMDAGASTIVDPYAGNGDIFTALHLHDCHAHYVGYDIDPELNWPKNDGLKDIPEHDNAIVVTNPPYLAKNSANRNDLESYKYFKDNDYEDLYQLAIHRVLARYKKAVFIIPETYYQNGIFTSYLQSHTIIEENPFIDTDCPVCVACFHTTNDFRAIAGNNYDIYKNDEFLFNRNTLEDILWDFNFSRQGSYAWSTPRRDMTFNDSDGNLGLRGVDGVAKYDRIRFCHPKDLKYDVQKIKESSRAITIINVAGVEVNDVFIARLNFSLRALRHLTYDVVLSPFKNNNKLGQRRRRLDFKWARKIIEKTMEGLDK
jgi:hypothetical protein